MTENSDKRSSERSNQQDLLQATLRFNQNQFSPQDQLFQLTTAGKITQINEQFIELIKQEPSLQNELANIVNNTDRQGKTPLFYACYYNYQNLVLYYLMKGADPYHISGEGQSVFHHCCFQAHHQCIGLILNHQRHRVRIQLLQELQEAMNQCHFKRSDVKNGELISSEKYVKSVQNKFQEFRDMVYQIYGKYLGNLTELFRRTVLPTDANGRNPIHYSSLNRFAKCIQCAQQLLGFSLQLEGFDEFYQQFMQVQLLDLNQDKRIDPRQYVEVEKYCQNFLKPLQRDSLLQEFKKVINKIIEQAIQSQDNEGYTPMHLSSFYGDYMGVEYFKKLGGNDKITDSKLNQTVIQFSQDKNVRKRLSDLKGAARTGDFKSLNLLMNCGQQLDGQSTIFGLAPIHNAVQNCHYSNDFKLLQELIKCHADLNIPDSNGYTPLHLACKLGNLQIVKILVSCHVDVNIPSSKGNMPLHVCAQYNRYEIIEYLLTQGDSENKPEIECRNQDQFTPLMLASQKGNISCIQLLLKLGANIYATDQRLWTSLHLAAHNYHSDCVELLCFYDDDFDKLREMKNAQGQTAQELVVNEVTRQAFQNLLYASKKGDINTVRRLVLLNQEVNIQSVKFRNLPITYAVYYNHLIVAKFLIENNADPTVKNSIGQSALDYAEEIGDQFMLNILKGSQ